MDFDDAARIIAQAQKRKLSSIPERVALRDALSMFGITLQEFSYFCRELIKVTKKEPSFVILTPTGGKSDWRLKKKRR